MHFLILPSSMVHGVQGTEIFLETSGTHVIDYSFRIQILWIKKLTGKKKIKDRKLRPWGSIFHPKKKQI